MSDQIAVMNLGRIEQIGSPQEIYDRPATRFVAGFIGNANIFPVDIDAVDATDQGAVARVHAGALAFAAPVGQAPTGPRGAVSIRHERIKTGAAARGLASTARAQIRDVIFSGSAVTYALAVEGAGSSCSRRRRMTARADSHTGSMIDIGWDAGAPRLFAAE